LYRIEARGLHKSFARAGGGRLPVLDGLDLIAEPGQLHSILGFSGCGKTLLLRLIAGLADPDRGEVWFGDEARPPRIGMVFQEPRLLPWASIGDNLRLALRHSGLAGAELNRRIVAMLELVGLGGCATLRPCELSGGMAQRAALARTLLREPDLLLLDEPLGALDPLTRRCMQDELTRLRTVFAPTTLLVTHDVAEAIRIADRISLLANGRIAHSFVVRSQVGDPPLDATAARHLEDLVVETLFSYARPAPVVTTN
jgi:ABC-type nitrate/sulfonate/bicarbonate transport system ATPase subunit